LTQAAAGDNPVLELAVAAATRCESEQAGRSMGHRSARKNVMPRTTIEMLRRHSPHHESSKFIVDNQYIATIISIKSRISQRRKPAAPRIARVHPLT
jgi:hypothetical protein